MKIRKIKDNELTDLLQLYTHLHANDSKADPEKLASTWDKIQANDHFHCLGLFDNKKLTASCCLIVIDNLTRECRPYGLIENVVTGVQFRRKGYGKALLGHALTLSWSLNCYKVMLMTGRLNEETFRFYEEAGFNRLAKQAFVATPNSS